MNKLYFLNKFKDGFKLNRTTTASYTNHKIHQMQHWIHEHGHYDKRTILL